MNAYKYIGRRWHIDGVRYRVAAIYGSLDKPWAWMVRDTKKPKDTDHIRVSVRALDEKETIS